MSESISRRSFMKSSALFGASAILGSGIRGSVFADVNVDIAAVKGADYFKNTIKAVEILGGMPRFVPKQSKVGLLINSPWQYAGSYVNPDITLAVLRMCLDAGAREMTPSAASSNRPMRFCVSCAASCPTAKRGFDSGETRTSRVELISAPAALANLQLFSYIFLFFYDKAQTSESRATYI